MLVQRVILRRARRLVNTNIFRRPAVESRHGSAVAKALFLVHVGADSIREHEYLARYIDTCGMFEHYLVSTYGGVVESRGKGDNVWNVGENVGF